MSVRIPLSEVLESFETGRRPKGGAVEVGVPSLGGEHVTAEGTIKLEPMKYVPEDFYRSMSKGRLQIGDVLVVKDGATTGRVGMVEPAFPFERAGINEHLFLLRADRRRLDPQFLYFYLRSTTGQAELMSDFRGAAQGGISREIGMKVSVPLLSLGEQRRIVDLLSRAEGIVRLRREAQQKAAELIPAIFIDMFGDPASNPKGWQVVPLGEVIRRGPSNGLYKHRSAYGAGTPILRIDGFYDGAITGLSQLKRVQLEDEDELRRFALVEGDIVVNRVNSPEYLGKSAIVPRLAEPTVFESNMMRFGVDGSRGLPEFVIALLQQPASRRHLLANAKHAINQSSINQQDVKSVPVPLPPVALQQAFAQRIAAVASIRGQQAEATSTAQASFDALLAGAFRGT